MPRGATSVGSQAFGDGPPPSANNERFMRTVVSEPAYGGQPASAKHGYLTMIAGMHAGAVVKLPADECVLGRAPESTLRIDSEGVSWKHARIFRAGEAYIVEDCKSTNGTGINDKRVDFHKLSEGDRIHLGPGVILRFNLYDELEAGVQLQLYESAVRDPLTRAFNRKYFQERLRAEVAYAMRHQTPLSLITFDIDFFKKVNDSFGHPGGDQVLRAVSAAILGVVRTEDVFARVGGEEFAILARMIDPSHAMPFAERLRLGVAGMQIPWNDGVIPVTASFGVATLAELPTADGDQLVALADKRLYDAKAGGRNRVVGPPITQP